MKKLFSLFFVLLLVFGCKEEILLPELVNGEDGISTIFAFDVLAPTDDHTNGGWVMEVGGDLNANGTLEPEEIQATVPIWHGNDGINGTDGTNGLDGANGTSVTISEDGYWELDGVVTEFKALGVDGQNGTNGVDGANGKSPYIGEDGYWYYYNDVTNEYETTNIKAEGKDGVDGQTPDLYLVTVDLPATEGHENGGTLVTTVWDKNGDQLISEDEIIGAYTVWNGNNGADGQDGADGKSPFIGEDGNWYYWDIELNIWVNGGKAQGADGQDGAAGIDGKSPYILNGYWYFWNGTEWINGGKAQGEKGDTGAQGEKGERGTIVGYTVETALNCSTSGYRVTMTIDEGLETEYELWFEVCDGRVGDTGAQGVQGPKGDKGDAGIDGYNSLVFVSEKIDGCIYISTGLDLNRDGELSRDEVTDTKTVCDGDDGDNGKTSIVLAERFTRSGYSGVMITTGFDSDGDYSTIEEVLSISYILDGTDGDDGETTTITLEEDGDCVIITTYLGETQIDTETICSCSLDDCDDDGCGEDNNKVAVCNSLGNGRTNTIWINENAVDAHLNRNPDDTLGECEYESGSPQ